MPQIAIKDNLEPSCPS